MWHFLRMCSLAFLVSLSSASAVAPTQFNKKKSCMNFPDILNKIGLTNCLTAFENCGSVLVTVLCSCVRTEDQRQSDRLKPRLSSKLICELRFSQHKICSNLWVFSRRDKNKVLFGQHRDFRARGNSAASCARRHWLRTAYVGWNDRKSHSWRLC